MPLGAPRPMSFELKLLRDTVYFTDPGQHTPEIVELVRNWIKETYPKYKFSVSRHNYNSIHIYLVKADFEAFRKDKGVVFHHDVNHYNIDGDQTLTDRAKEVMKNVCDFVMSYNFDDSDPMTDYFCTNFYLTLGVGTYKKPYKIELPKLDCLKSASNLNGNLNCSKELEHYAS